VLKDVPFTIILVSTTKPFFWRALTNLGLTFQPDEKKPRHRPDGAEPHHQHLRRK